MKRGFSLFLVILSAISLYSQTLSKTTNVNLIFVKGSEFTMGYDESILINSPELKPMFDRGWASGSKPHSVLLADFYMSEAPITQFQYEKITGSNPISLLEAESIPYGPGYGHLTFTGHRCNTRRQGKTPLP